MNQPTKSTAVRTSLAVLGCAVVALAWRCAPVGSKQDIAAHHVAGPVHYLEGRGGNIGISAGADGVLMIDDKFANLAPQIRAAIEGISADPIEFLINTHHHGDHTGGNPVFGGEATILAHENVRTRLQAPDPRSGETMDAVGWPVLTFPRQVNVHFNGEEIRVVHFPACHTDGDSVVFFTGSNVVHMGDLFFLDRFPFVDLDAGGSVAGLIEGVTAVLGQIADDTHVIPGHGTLATKADLERYRDMLVETRALVAAAVAEGASADDLERDGILSDHAQWGGGFITSDKFLDTLVRELTQ
jgi:glyoxylase-like metal-dependent hydrolase (beta-lactamase superfamily II)